jgi:hypothetical protein
MARQIRVRGIRRREVDEDKLALAFLMLAKVLHDEAQPPRPDDSPDEPSAGSEPA